MEEVNINLKDRSQVLEITMKYLFDKIECDFQAKIYDLEGAFDVEEAKIDLAYMGVDTKRIEEKAKTASDYWIEYDRPKYADDVIFENLLDEIKGLYI